MRRTMGVQRDVMSAPSAQANDSIELQTQSLMDLDLQSEGQDREIVMVSGASLETKLGQLDDQDHINVCNRVPLLYRDCCKGLF